MKYITEAGKGGILAARIVSLAWRSSGQSPFNNRVFEHELFSECNVPARKGVSATVIAESVMGRTLHLFFRYDEDSVTDLNEVYTYRVHPFYNSYPTFHALAVAAAAELGISLVSLRKQ